MKQLLTDAATTLAPYVVELLIAALVAGAAWLKRSSVQRAAAEDAATTVEMAALAGMLDKGDKKSEAVAIAGGNLRNLLVRPLSHAGLDRLVEKAVPAARKRARDSIAPQPVPRLDDWPGPPTDDENTPPDRAA